MGSPRVCTPREARRRPTARPGLVAEDLGKPGSYNGAELLRILAALANPQRLRVLTALADGRNYVSQLARDLGMSRTLLHMHLKRLEAAGLVTGKLELSPDGNAMKFFEVSDFALHLTPRTIAEAGRSLGEGQEAISTEKGSD